MSTQIKTKEVAEKLVAMKRKIADAINQFNIETDNQFTPEITIDIMTRKQAGGVVHKSVIVTAKAHLEA